MKQARSARTRQALIEAAAGEFDRHGYAGSSLAQISKAAGISMGALTFHFSSKEELAATVRSRGHHATTAVVHQVSAAEAAPAQAVVQLTLALARLLEEEAVVRAAARLTQEQPGAATDWDSAWAPTISDWLQAPGAEGSDPAAFSTLATLLVLGTEADMRRRATALAAGHSPVQQLSRVWELSLSGAATPHGAGSGDGVPGRPVRGHG
ncbi:TetR family transcriptional regulator [Streptomyces cyaneofuscatus]|uniref:TetR family transcriptional regulator n=1 Tax=Streptomyces cyaneofuscatus TaxID=66883 RepID=UPI0036DBA46A